MLVNDLDDVLQHYGVKGMRWGQVKSGVQKSVKKHIKKQNAKEKAALEKYHSKRIDNPKYKKRYDALIKRKYSHPKAVRTIREANNRTNLLRTGLTLKVASPYMVPAVKFGAKQAGKVHRYATSPEAIRAGKNILQAVKKSPVRYVDGKTMTNVLNDINNASTRRIGQW